MLKLSFALITTGFLSLCLPAPDALALDLGRMGGDRVHDPSQRQLGNNTDRTFGPAHPSSRYGRYTGKNLGSYNGSGLGSYTGGGMGGTQNFGTGSPQGDDDSGDERTPR